MIIKLYEEKYRDDLIFMVLQAKDALGRKPTINTDLLDIKTNYFDRGDLFWVAIDKDDRVIGCVGYSKTDDPSEAFLHRLYVKAAEKHKGIGTKLLQTAENEMRKQGIVVSLVHLGEPREQWFESYSFYPKNGYWEYKPRYMRKDLWVDCWCAEEIWDAYYADGTLAGGDLVRGEPIPEGLHHLVSEILVRHTDGDYLLMQRDFCKPNYGGYFEATAGGSALKGEDAFCCARRELREETGIATGTLTNTGRFVSRDTIYETFLCVTDCDKASIKLQEGETVSYKWISEVEFIDFVNSDAMIGVQFQRYLPYFKQIGYVR